MLADTLALPFGFTILDAKPLAEAQAATDRFPSMPELAQQVDTFWGAHRRVPTARQGRSATAVDDSWHVHPGVSHAVRAGACPRGRHDGVCVAFLLFGALAWGTGTVWYAKRRDHWPSIFTRLLGHHARLTQTDR